ncbi:sulfite exporter TauE/SafE family protein [Pseudoroseomonas globiformis]|uniref:Probable membrane transporter protein n=1 Tax=Teichococcus globiformis TaxID=2307229 RepID=A0ABV7G2J9_9PROT
MAIANYLITDPLFYALAVPAVLITGISKGGFASGGGNLFVPAVALLIPAPQAAAICLPILCAMDIAGLRAWWGRWSKREMRVILPSGLLGIAIGAFAFGLMTDRAIKLMVGGIALAFLARSLWLARGTATSRPARPSVGRGGFWSAVSGFTSTIAHAGGPPLAVYLYPLRLERAQLAATTVVFFGMVNYVKLLPYALLGQFSLSNMLTSLALMPLAPVGVRLGVWLQGRVSDRLFYRLIYVLLGATGLKLVADGLGF